MKENWRASLGKKVHEEKGRGKIAGLKAIESDVSAYSESRTCFLMKDVAKSCRMELGPAPPQDGCH